jgi:hypothetical protein
VSMNLIDKTDLRVPLCQLHAKDAFTINHGEFYILIQDDTHKESDGRLRCFSLSSARINKYNPGTMVRPVHLSITATTDLEKMPK